MERKQPFMFFPTVQSRIIAGLFSFTGIIIIIFWVAINEPARMEEFTERSEGRKIENGAAIYESNCSTCHGPEGYGLTNRAPALNNPVLFGHNFFDEQDVAIAGLTSQLEALPASASDDDRIALELDLQIAELERQQIYDDLRYNYAPELASFEADLNTSPEDGFLLANRDGYKALMDAHNIIVDSRARQIELLRERNTEGADQDALDAEFSDMQMQIDANLDARETAFNALVDGSLLLRPFDPEFTARMTELDWSGSTHAFIYSTIQSGRPVSNTYWGDPMVAWGQAAGGPLRSDQIESLADYVMNWNREFTREDVRKIQQYAVIVPDCVRDGCGGDAVEEGPQLTDPALTEDQMTYMEETMAILDTFVGDSVNGQILYESAGCIACHIAGNDSGTGPNPEGLALRAESYATDLGYPEASWYIAESILDPGAFAALKDPSNLDSDPYPVLMALPYWQTLSEQDLADIISYLESFDN